MMESEDEFGVGGIVGFALCALDARNFFEEYSDNYLHVMKEKYSRDLLHSPDSQPALKRTKDEDRVADGLVLVSEQVYGP